MKNGFIKKYNQNDSLLVISGYPKKNQTYSQGVCAVSSFTKNTLIALQIENPLRKIVVFAPIINKNEIYEEDGMLIVRCFKRNAPLSYLGLLKNIIYFNRVKNVLLEFEFASFGNTFMTSLLAPLAWIMFLNRKYLTIVVHQVVSDMGNLSGHIGISRKTLKMKLLNLSLELFYAFLTLPAKKVVVLEEEFKNKLSKVTNKNKITVIPHGIDTKIQKINKEKARKELKINNEDLVILYFGYLTWYKGVDFLIRSLKDVNTINGKRIKIIIAGGPSFTQKEKAHYLKFISKVNSLIKKSTNIIATGFVEEKDIPTIFSAADLAILPYRAFMSSSGPLSLAISYAKPFIISDKLEGITHSLDFEKALELAKIDEKQIIFKLDKTNLVKTIKMSMDPKIKRKMILLSKALKEARSFNNIAKDYDVILSKDNIEAKNEIYKLIPANN